MAATHHFQDGAGSVRVVIGLQHGQELEHGAQAPSVGQRDDAGRGLTHHVAAEVDELLVQGQLPADPE